MYTNANMEDLRMYTVDAFTSRCFSGNPAAVCPDTTPNGIPEETMQKLALEMNLSETAFVRPLSPDSTFVTARRFRLRWFTPLVEIKMCGHATLASAFVLFHQLGNQSETITFETLSGELMVRRDGEFMEMDFPTSHTEQQDKEDYQPLVKVLFGEPDEVENIAFCPSLRYLLIHVKDGWSRDDFEKWSPPIGSMPAAEGSGRVILVCVTMRGGTGGGFVDTAGEPYDFVSRSFAPWTGVPEDPVTGSAHTVLANYWLERLGKRDFYARQCSRRGGELRVSHRGNRTLLRGQAVLVMKGSVCCDVSGAELEG